MAEGVGPMMWIEKIQPDMVAAKCSLPNCLAAEALKIGCSSQEADDLVRLLPAPLAVCGCFLDKLTGIWRYEFGAPHTVGTQLVWGTHMWASVLVLLDCLVCARLRLRGAKLDAYLKLLTDDGKHQEYLAEMFPMLRVDPAIPADYELSGRGTGNKTIDWSIQAAGRIVFMDVKRRFADFYAQMSLPANESMPAPEHDPLLLFRSVEQKFLTANPDSVLQGAFIVTDIKQESRKLDAAFASLDATKVHFAVLGDQRPDVHLLVRREQDRPLLLDLFQATRSHRFVFNRHD